MTIYYMLRSLHIHCSFHKICLRGYGSGETFFWGTLFLRTTLFEKRSWDCIWRDCTWWRVGPPVSYPEGAVVDGRVLVTGVRGGKFHGLLLFQAQFALTFTCSPLTIAGYHDKNWLKRKLTKRIYPNNTRDVYLYIYSVSAYMG